MIIFFDGKLVSCDESPRICRFFSEPPAEVLVFSMGTADRRGAIRPASPSPLAVFEGLPLLSCSAELFACGPSLLLRPLQHFFQRGYLRLGTADLFGGPFGSSWDNTLLETPVRARTPCSAPFHPQNHFFLFSARSLENRHNICHRILVFPSGIFAGTGPPAFWPKLLCPALLPPSGFQVIVTMFLLNKGLCVI